MQISYEMVSMALKCFENSLLKAHVQSCGLHYNYSRLCSCSFTAQLAFPPRTKHLPVLVHKKKQFSFACVQSKCFQGILCLVPWARDLMVRSVHAFVITHVVIYRFTHCLTKLSLRTSCCVPLLVEALNRSVSCRRDGTSLKWWWRVMNWWLKNRWVKPRSKQEESRHNFKLLLACWAWVACDSVRIVTRYRLICWILSAPIQFDPFLWLF